MPNRPDALQMLKKDHQQVRQLLDQLDDTTSRAKKTRAELLKDIALELQVHTKLEEEIFYPAFREAAQKSDDEELYWESLEEHGLVEDFELPRIQDTEVTSAEFGAKASVLKELVTHHAREEEKNLFPRAKKLLGAERLRELGERMEERKKQLKAQMKAQMKKAA